MTKFLSRKFIFGVILIFWVPTIIIKMHESGIPSDVLMSTVVGLFSIGGVYNFVQGLIDKVQK